METNSKMYWEDRFKGDWQFHHGGKQTEFFCRLAIEHLPKWIVEKINSAGLSICDAGCALGNATAMLASFFKLSSVMGVDFSEEAVRNATMLFPSVKFRSGTIEDLPEVFDVIFCSNVLEHFEQPIHMLQQIMNKTRNYSIILVPFEESQENLCKEHFYRFDKDSFPVKIGHFQKLHESVIDCEKLPGSMWPGKQLLVIYGKASN